MLHFLSPTAISSQGFLNMRGGGMMTLVALPPACIMWNVTIFHGLFQNILMRSRAVGIDKRQKGFVSCTVFFVLLLNVLKAFIS
jgi:hypothetical protein